MKLPPAIYEKIKSFLKKEESKIALISGFILVAVISFEAGHLKGQGVKDNPIIIEKASQESVKNETPAQLSDTAPEVKSVPIEAKSDIKKCAFVGSKNSNKYHLPSCKWAKRIKPENIICFSSAEDAAKKGYQPDKTCIK